MDNIILLMVTAETLLFCCSVERGKHNNSIDDHQTLVEALLFYNTLRLSKRQQRQRLFIASQRPPNRTKPDDKARHIG